MVGERALGGNSVNRHASSFRKTFLALLYPPPEAMGSRNRLSVFVFFVLTAVGGSGASIVCGVLGSWALISAVVRRVPFRLERTDRPVVFSFLLYAAVMTLTAVLRPDWARGAKVSVPLLVFLIPLFLIPRLRLTPSGALLPAALTGAAVGGTLLLPASLLSAFVFSAGRMEGIAGNPGPFSVTSLVTLGLSLCLLVNAPGRRWMTVLAMTGATGAASAVILSGMRGSWLALPFVIAVPLIVKWRSVHHVVSKMSRRQRLWRGAAFSIVVLLIGYVVSTKVVGRLMSTESDLAQLFDRTPQFGSFSARAEMYRASLAAISEAPVFGYGRQHLWDAVRPYFDASFMDSAHFTHLHNILLTIAVDAGAVGIVAFFAMVLAPAWTAWRARSLPEGGTRFAVAATLFVAYFIPGLTNIMFFHDILDAVWIFTAAVIVASVPAGEERGIAARSSR
ncbi:O-antigen ligase family protein [Consotaella salsifontis]|uniref:O-antigen ligase n=1 Tax=Consotaella salsifontis TaxID=1365950 RepID=A0A1T4MVR2_9HYPH|nr:O-antigen ligase family protein [Consotaella salsifontis]SJZ71053.1 O-antigen ligase [Consotaella salsifontis]